MHDNELDTFPQEGDTPAARVEAATTKVIIITNDEITSSLESFPTEDPVSRPTNDPLPSDPLAGDPLASATYLPPSRLQTPGARTSRFRWKPFTSAALVAAFGIGLFAGQAIVARLVAPLAPQRHAVRTTTVTAPAASAESPTVGAVAAKAADVENSNEAVNPVRGAANVVNTGKRARPPQRSPRPEPKARLAAVAAPDARQVVPARATVAQPPIVARPLAISPLPMPPPSSTAPPPAAALPPVAAAISPTSPAPAPVPTALAAPAPVVASPVAASPVAAPPVAAPTVAGPPVAVAPASEMRAVLGTLHRYQQAFSALDSNAAQQVWPDVNVRALDRAFDQLAQQTFDLRACDVGVSGEHAEAMCTGTASYARKVGNKAMRVESRQWRFTLRRDSGDWLIQRVDVR